MDGGGANAGFAEDGDSDLSTVRLYSVPEKAETGTTEWVQVQRMKSAKLKNRERLRVKNMQKVAASFLSLIS